LAEFFGDFMTVNGKIWPKLSVEDRTYRLRFLNGCDSRFLVLRLVAVDEDVDKMDPQAETIEGDMVPMMIIGGDQGLVYSSSDGPMTVTTLLVEPGSRYDILVDFSNYRYRRIVLMNFGGDEPFGGDVPGTQAFAFTDRIMAFDVEVEFDTDVPEREFKLRGGGNPEGDVKVDNIRRLGLFEGHDEQGRLLPMLGTIDPAEDKNGYPINYPDTKVFRDAGLIGPIQGSAPWHYPTTENPKLGATEEWEIWNLTGDAHPIHLHLIHFEVVKRQWIVFDSKATEDGEIEFHDGMTPAGDGTYTMDIPVISDQGGLAEGYMVMNPTYGDMVNLAAMPEYVENFPKDVMTALPKQITTIRATFDKPGKVTLIVFFHGMVAFCLNRITCSSLFNTGHFNWHCHILSHEDHEMMRVFHVGSLPSKLPIHNPDQHERSVDNCAAMTADGCEPDSARISISSSVLGNDFTVMSILMVTMIASATVVMELVVYQ
jgi:spore coat protein A, manganese oxidase